MFPIGLSAPPAHRRPYATAALVVVALTVFAWVLLLREAPEALFCSDLTESPQASLASADTVQGFVCRAGAIPDELHRGQRLGTLVTSVFVHTSWLHLLSNLLFLGAFAPRVEEDLGRAGLVGLFLGSAVVAGAAHVLLVPNLTDPSIGASGGVAGLLGAHLLLARGAQVWVLVGPVPLRLPTRFVLGMWLGLQLLYTALTLRLAEYPGGVSYEVHVVGFVVGMAAVSLALLRRPGLRQWQAPPASTREETLTIRGVLRQVSARSQPGRTGVGT